MLGKIKEISTVFDVKASPNCYSKMDGYKVATDQHTYHVLIDNDQS